MDTAKLRLLREVMQLVELPVRPVLTKENCIAELQRVKKQLGHTPTREEFDVTATLCSSSIKRTFGTWNKGLDASGLTRNHSTDGITKTQLLPELKRVAKTVGHTPIRDEFDKHSTFSVASVVRAFGTWTKGLLAANMVPSRAAGHNRHQVTAEIKRVSKLLGHKPQVSEFDAHSLTVCAGTVIKKFGTWRIALKTL
jgi:hypothetical protein